MYICQYCQRNCKNAGGLANHEPYCNQNPNKQIRKISNKCIQALKIRYKKYINTWEGLSEDERQKRIEKAKSKLVGKPWRASSIEVEIERRRKISETMKKNGAGGYRRGSGRGKKGWYKGFFCDSSYELAFLIYCLDNNIDIKRNKDKLPYTFEGKSHIYIPDFIVDGKYIEIKGYKTKQFEEKLKWYPNIVVYYEEDLKEVFNYVENKYGKNYISLYENKGAMAEME